MISRRQVISTPIALAAAVLPFDVRAKSPDSVTVGLSLAPDTLDPTTTVAAAVGEVVHGNILEGLTKIDETGEVQPLLAEGWDVSPDKLRYVFRLKKNVYFHDGNRLDASVVKYSLERCKAVKGLNKLHETLFKNIISIFAPDAYRVVIELQHPNPLLPFRLGESPAVILHPATAGHATRHPIGTGPYRLESWQPGHNVVLRRWPGFRDPGTARIEHGEFYFVPDPSQQVESIVEGRVDVLFHISTRTINQFEASNQYEIMFGQSSSKGLLALNNRQWPLDDIRVRRAIAHAIDREAFIRAAFEGRGRAIGSHFVPTDPGYINLTSLFPYDPDRARALLKEAGVKTPLKLTLTLPPTPYALAGRDFVVAALHAVGIQAEVHRVNWSEWLQRVFREYDFDMTLILHAEPLDYHIYTRPDYYFGYDSAAFRDLVNRHANTHNPRAQRQLFTEIQRHLANDAVNAWLFTPEIATVVRKGLKGVWMNYPVFVHDLGAMYWDADTLV